MKHFAVLLAGTLVLDAACNAAEGDKPPDIVEVTEFGNIIATHLGVEPLSDAELKVEAVRRDVALLVAWLANTSEIAIHQMGGATDNKVYVGKEGHLEAVYDGAGQLVNDSLNDGSYNYASPESDPLGHFAVDILPWIEFGSSPKDTSKKQTRVDAYLQDLRAGLHRAATGPIPTLDDDFNWRDARRDVTVRLFRMALTRTQQRLSDILPAEGHDAEQIDAWFDKFSEGLNDVLMQTERETPASQ